MSFKIFSIGTFYQGNLDLFYINNPGTNDLSYDEHNRLLLNETTEFTGSYYRNFRILNTEMRSIIANDNRLQNKWAVENGLKKGDIQDIIFGQINAFQPDILLIENLSLVNRDWLENLRGRLKTLKLIIATHCAPFNSKVLNSLGGVDFVITCTPGIKSELEGMGVKSYLVYHGFDSGILERLGKSDNPITDDFIFSGSLISGGSFHSQRTKLIDDIISEGIDIGLYVNLEKEYRIKAKQTIFLFSRFLKSVGMGSITERYRIFDYGSSWVDGYSDSLKAHKKAPLFGMEMFKLFLHSKVVLNYHIGMAGDYAGNMRMFEVTGIGSCLLTDNKKNINELFEQGAEVITYDNSTDCIEKVKWLLEHENERKSIAEAGQARTLRSHTVMERCKEILDIVNSELK
jgi:spore maturation protein CgeB